jgi:pyrimidine-specific ribonucleoside hydrolase
MTAVGVRSVLAAAMLAIAAIAAADTRPAPPPWPVIVDTDAGPDDLMAIAFLLSRADVRIVAICIDVGEAHQAPGARNVLRVLALAGRGDVPVYLGRQTPLPGGHEFPAEWRRTADELPGVTLPAASRSPERRPAAAFLADRLSDRGRPVDVLALGALTNLAEAFAAGRPAALRELVIMGGAIRVGGNLASGGVAGNRTAEWNFYVDPAAAERVFASGVPIRLVPLDATNTVRIDRGFVAELRERRLTPLSRLVLQVLDSNHEFIDDGTYFAWDPLAAVALVAPDVVRVRDAAVTISRKPGEEGRTIVTTGTPNARIGYDADAARFRDIFLSALAP